MVYCDENNDIEEWGSEELIVPYISPLDRKRHRYFPDFYIKTKNGDKFMIEIKPKKFTKPPKATKRVTKAFYMKLKNGQGIVQSGSCTRSLCQKTWLEIFNNNRRPS